MGPPDKIVRHFRQILLWPLQLMPSAPALQIQKHWELLEPDGRKRSLARGRGRVHRRSGASSRNATTRSSSASCPTSSAFSTARCVAARAGSKRSARRCGCFVATTWPRCGSPPGRTSRRASLDVAHVDLYFFYDTDVVAAERGGARRQPCRCSRRRTPCTASAAPTRPPGTTTVKACTARTGSSGSARDGQVLAVSDFERREKYLAFVCSQRAPRISSHWAFLLWPLVLDQSDETGCDPLPADRVSPHAGHGLPGHGGSRARCRAAISCGSAW